MNMKISQLIHRGEVVKIQVKHQGVQLGIVEVETDATQGKIWRDVGAVLLEAGHASPSRSTFSKLQFTKDKVSLRVMNYTTTDWTAKYMKHDLIVSVSNRVQVANVPMNFNSESKKVVKDKSLWQKVSEFFSKL